MITAYALIAWAAAAVILALLQGPVWLNLPVTGLFSVLGFGWSVVLWLGWKPNALSFGFAVAAGFASLILLSVTVLYISAFSALMTLVLQCAIVTALCLVVLWRETRPDAARPEPVA